MDVLIVSKGSLGKVKLVKMLHPRSLKVMEFIIELHHGNLEEDEVSVEASP